VNESSFSAALEADELLALSIVDLEKGNYEGALTKLKRALQTEGAPPQVHSTLAKLYADLRLYARAEIHFKEYLAVEPNALIEKFQLGMTFFDRGNVDQARTLWEEVLSAQGDYFPVLYYLALCHARTNVSQARGYAERLLRLAPSDNLYFDRTRQLLQSLDIASSPGSDKSNTREGELQRGKYSSLQ
jgi:tetratricopeptide (TPR) repeat protein